MVVWPWSTQRHCCRRGKCVCRGSAQCAQIFTQSTQSTQSAQSTQPTQATQSTQSTQVTKFSKFSKFSKLPRGRKPATTGALARGAPSHPSQRHMSVCLPQYRCIQCHCCRRAKCECRGSAQCAQLFTQSTQSTQVTKFSKFSKFSKLSKLPRDQNEQWLMDIC